MKYTFLYCHHLFEVEGQQGKHEPISWHIKRFFCRLFLAHISLMITHFSTNEVQRTTTIDRSQRSTYCKTLHILEMSVIKIYKYLELSGNFFKLNTSLHQHFLSILSYIFFFIHLLT